MTPYTLFLDKPTEFKCKIQLEGASLKNSHARLVLSHNQTKMLYEGTIDPSGQCSIEIPKLSEWFSDSDAGKLQLEVIADGAYFAPWESDFKLDKSRKVTVEVAQPKAKPIPQIRVEVQSKKTSQDYIIENTVTFLKKNGVTKANALKNKKMIRESLISNIEKYNESMDPSSLVRQVIETL